jgi:hypothetical protein
MTQIVDRATGLAQDVKLTVEDYQAAFDAGLTFPQYLNNKFDTDEDKHGTAFEQALASNNMFLRSDRVSGIRPPSMKDVLSGSVNINMGPVVRPDGSNTQSLAGRLLFPAVVLEMIDSELRVDSTSYEGVFNSMIATTANVDSPRVDQPIINLTAPRAVRSQPIAQLSAPPAMVSITLSEKSFRLPTFSIGMEISDEAQQAATLDLVGIALREQAAAERAAMIDEGIKNMVDGDVDLGMSALSAELVTVYDSTIATAGTITQKAWLKWLRKDWQKMSITDVICSLDVYLAIEARANRPVVVGDNGNDLRLNTLLSVANPGLPDRVNFFIVEPELLGANTLVGLDRSKAIRKAVYTGASFSAIQEFALKRSSALRIDFSLGYFRLIDTAWKKLSLTTS